MTQKQQLEQLTAAMAALAITQSQQGEALNAILATLTQATPTQATAPAKPTRKAKPKAPAKTKAKAPAKTKAELRQVAKEAWSETTFTKANNNLLAIMPMEHARKFKRANKDLPVYAWESARTARNRTNGIIPKGMTLVFSPELASLKGLTIAKEWEVTAV